MAEHARLELVDVSMRFHDGERDIDVLRGANLAAQAGELVAIVAPSGAGM